MCCLVSVLAFLGPRGCMIVWVLLSTRRWELAFDGFLLPLLGFLFMPWTTLAYVAFGVGRVGTFDQLLIAIAVLIDVFTWGAGAWRNRERYMKYA